MTLLSGVPALRAKRAREYDVLFDSSEDSWAVLFRDPDDSEWYVLGKTDDDETVAKAAVRGLRTMPAPVPPAPGTDHDPSDGEWVAGVNITRRQLRAEREAARAHAERAFRDEITADFRAGKIGVEKGWLFEYVEPTHGSCTPYGCPPSCYSEPIVDLWSVFK